MEKAKLNALAVRARDGNEETLLNLYSNVYLPQTGQI